MYDTVIFERLYNSDIGWSTYAVSMPRMASMSKERYLDLLRRTETNVEHPLTDIVVGTQTIEFNFANGHWLYEVGELDKDRFLPLKLIEGKPR